jgi:hypothetical protein
MANQPARHGHAPMRLAHRRALSEGMICLGCAHAQPKNSAVPNFRRMLASHERSLVAARGHSEPAGQIAAREMETVRIDGALQRAEELSGDVAAAIEGIY